ncbi:hypothetical protein VCHC47A1_2365, partial [Vibrio cholerae HC-47A1]
MFSFS